MSDPSIIQSGTQAVENVVGGLVSVPILLIVALINLGYIVMGGWFLVTQEKYRHDERVEVGGLLRVCIVGDKPEPAQKID